MPRAAHNQEAEAPARPRRDEGASYVELLVAVVLLGTAVIAVLGALRVTLISTATERDHARAHQWLQSAIGVLQETDYVPCDDVGTYATAQEHIVADYEAAIVAGTNPPPSWAASQIEIVDPIEVWDGNRYWTPAETADPDDCFKADGFSLQLITLQVRNTDGSIVETVQVVKDE